MRKWLKHADSDDITMVVSGAVAVAAFCTFVIVWFIETPGAGMRKELQHGILVG